MKQRKSLLWIYIVLGCMILEGVMTALCLFEHRQYSPHDMSVVTTLLNQMAGWWKYSFAALLLAAFCRTKKYPPHAEKEYLDGGTAALILLLVKIVYDTALLMVPGIFRIGLSWEYLWFCFGRMTFYVGVLGIPALVLGTIGAKIPVRGGGYALTAAVLVFVTSLTADVRYVYVNPYNPCPLRNPFVLKKETSWSLSELYKGSVYEEYPGVRENFSVTDYELSVWISQRHLLSARAEMKLSDSDLGEYVFRLNDHMRVERVMDGVGTDLDWRQEGNYVAVCANAGLVSEIIMVYSCDDDRIIPVENDYVSLPSYLMWYPAAPDTKSDYSVKVYFDHEIYCNLEKQGKNVFSGNAYTVSLLSGMLAGETFVGNARIIYPKLLFSEYYIQQYYLTQLVQIPKQYRIDMEGFDWFWDGTIQTSFGKYYDRSECLKDGYMY